MRIKDPHFFEDTHVQMWTWRPIRTSLELTLTSICFQEYSLVHLRMVDFASGQNDRFCNDKLNYMY